MGWFRDFVLVSSGIVSWKILTNFLRSRFGQRQEYSSVLFTNELSGCCMNANDCENQYCMSHVYVAIEKQIESAKQLICVAIYMFTNQRICDAIIRAYNRGVEVRVIVDQNTYGLSSGRVQDLQKAGIQVKKNSTDTQLMHHKFCLIDVLTNENKIDLDRSASHGVLINGSLNWTKNGVSRNYENIMVITDNSRIKAGFKCEFDRLWSIM